MTKKFGFTLAEVLITLGIIGVVAAMTIPTLIANTNGAKFRSQFKKTISTLNQAGLMGLAQYDFDYAGTDKKCNEATLPEGTTKEAATSVLSFCALLNDTLTGYSYHGALGSGSGDTATSPLKTKDGKNYTFTKASSDVSTTMANYIGYTLADGSLVAFNKDAKSCTLNPGETLTNDLLKTTGTDTARGLAQCVGFIDVNGTTLPNKEVKCKEGTTTTLTGETVCEVPNDAAHMTDVFPVVFHDATVEPATNAAKYVLTTSK